MGESPRASQSSFLTSSVTREPRGSSLAGSKGGSPRSERVDGTKTWSCVICPVEAWCLAWVMRHEWYGTPSLGELTCQRVPEKKGLKFTYAECRTQPTELLIVFDSEKAWCPHSCPITQIPVANKPAQKPYNAQREIRAAVYRCGFGNEITEGSMRRST
jgi:hypothetical protein